MKTLYDLEIEEKLLLKRLKELNAPLKGLRFADRVKNEVTGWNLKENEVEFVNSRNEVVTTEPRR